MEPFVTCDVGVRLARLEAYMVRCGQGETFRFDIHQAFEAIRFRAEGQAPHGLYTLTLRSCPCTIRYAIGEHYFGIVAVESPLLSQVADPPEYCASPQFSISVAFGLLAAMAVFFAVLKALSVPLSIVLGLVGFVAVVGLSQMVLFGGHLPRVASIVTGAVYCVLWCLAVAWNDAHPTSLEMFLGVALAGAIAGYLLGDVALRVFAHQSAVKARQQFQASQPARTG